jgi:DNA replication licensing factor MCM3
VFYLRFSLLNNAFEEQLAFQRALKEYVGSLDPTYAKETEELFVAFEGSFGNKHVTPRTLMSSFLGNLVCLEGIVTKCKWLVLHDSYAHWIYLQFVTTYF